MRNYLKNKMKDRLTYCHEWKNSVDIYLAGKEVTKKANEEYYKSKPLLKLILDVYFIPLNILKFLMKMLIRSLEVIDLEDIGRRTMNRSIWH